MHDSVGRLNSQGLSRRTVAPPDPPPPPGERPDLLEEPVGRPLPPHRPPHEMIAELEDRINYLERVIGALVKFVGFEPPDDLIRPPQ